MGNVLQACYCCKEENDIKESHHKVQKKFCRVLAEMKCKSFQFSFFSFEKLYQIFINKASVSTISHLYLLSSNLSLWLGIGILEVILFKGRHASNCKIPYISKQLEHT